MRSKTTTPRSRRSRVLTLVVILGLFASLPALATHPDANFNGRYLTGGSYFCDGSGVGAIGEGGSSQTDVHVNVFSKAFDEHCDDPDSTFSYQATEEKNAYQKLLERSRDFGLSDVPLSVVQKVTAERDLKQARGRTSDIHQIPLFIDSVAVGYNLSCLNSSDKLYLRSSVLSLIFSGVIKKWNHPSLAADNPKLLTCNQDIALVNREAFSGSTYNFKDYLSKRNPQWNYYKQPEQNTLWPPQASFLCTGDDEPGTAKCITGTSGSLGFVQLKVAQQMLVKTAQIEASSGFFYPPSVANCQEAANYVFNTAEAENLDIFGVLPFGTAGDWSTVSLTDPPLGYPICNFGYIYVFGSWNAAYAGQNAGGTIRTLVDYMLSGVGISLDPANHHRLIEAGYAPLPANIANVSLQGINAIRIV